MKYPSSRESRNTTLISAHFKFSSKGQKTTYSCKNDFVLNAPDKQKPNPAPTFINRGATNHPKIKIFNTVENLFTNLNKFH